MYDVLITFQCGKVRVCKCCTSWDPETNLLLRPLILIGIEKKRTQVENVIFNKTIGVQWFFFAISERIERKREYGI